MNFTAAIEASTDSERNDLITGEIENESWGDYLNDHMKYGGWPTDVIAESVKIDAPDEKSITAIVELHFLESVPSSCHDVNYEHKGQATYRIDIKKDTGLFAVENLDSDIAEYGSDGKEDDLDGGMTFPDDYN